jgi:LEA14-like dessication related protein
MTGKIYFAFFIFLFPIFILSACRQPVTPEYLGIETLVISKIGVNESRVAGNIKFYNPNPYGLRMKHADITILLEDMPSGHCILDSTIDIPRLDSFYVPVSVSVNPGNIVKNAFKLLLNGKIKINADGWVSFKKGLISFRVPVHFEEYQKLDDLLQQIQ